MKKKIFVTGITSEIIKNLIPLINFEEYDIIGFSRKPETIQMEHVRLIKGNLDDVSRFRKELRNCYMIIHAAAVTHSFRAAPYFKTNYQRTKELIQVAKDLKVERFILISSYTSGKNTGAYGKSKYLAEQYLMNQFSKWTIFRISEVFDSSKKEGIDKLIEKGFSNSFHICPIQISQKLRPIHLPEVSVLLKENIFDRPLFNETVNITGSVGYSIEEILKLIGVIKNRKQFILYVPKWGMKTIYLFTKALPFSLGVNPDQIQRLYRPKTKISDYVEIKGKSSLIDFLQKYER